MRRGHQLEHWVGEREGGRSEGGNEREAGREGMRERQGGKERGEGGHLTSTT